MTPQIQLPACKCSIFFFLSFSSFFFSFFISFSRIKWHSVRERNVNRDRIKAACIHGHACNIYEISVALLNQTIYMSYTSLNLVVSNRLNIDRNTFIDTSSAMKYQNCTAASLRYFQLKIALLPTKKSLLYGNRGISYTLSDFAS